jgi:hypothetical protein
VNEVEVDPFDGHNELPVPIELSLVVAPAIFFMPVSHERLHVREVTTVLPTTAWILVGPADEVKPHPQIGEHFVGNMDCEWLRRCYHFVSLGHPDNGMAHRRGAAGEASGAAGVGRHFQTGLDTACLTAVEGKMRLVNAVYPIG